MPDQRPAIVTIGSVHTDLIASVARLPGWGETLHGSGFAIALGGKAGNQAIAVAKCGGRSLILGRVGDDDFSVRLRAVLSAAGVDCGLLGTERGAATGASTVLAGPDGAYASVIVPGVSGWIGPCEIAAARPELASAALLLAQLEIPSAITVEAARIVRAGGGRVMVNASPLLTGDDYLDDLRALTDILIVNRCEAEVLAGGDGSTRFETSAAVTPAAVVRTRLGIPSVVVTLGGHGVVASDVDGEYRIRAIDVPIVDTIGAGDAFAGALAAELSRGVRLADALSFANAAGAAAVMRAGGAGSLPGRTEIEALLATASMQSR